ncbi:MAG: DedA family protein [Muribaculaceae bacterium]|nr:DedA family protein [Muribaculaceae bacterium]
MLILSIFDYLNAASAFQFFVDHASYWFVFLFMVIESSFIPFPSEVVVPPAAYLAVSRGDMNIFLVVLIATAGALCGALINYGLALWIGRPLVYRFANSRIGHICMINEEKVKKAEDYFYRHGAISTFIGRLIPTVRQLISIPAGLVKMNLVVFILFTTLGALIWNIVLGGLGYWLGKTVPYDQLFTTVEEYNQYLTFAGVSLGVLCLVYILYKAFKKKQTPSL